jgi:hypothetical protein
VPARRSAPSKHRANKSFACLREAASAKAEHAGVAISLKKTRLLPFTRNDHLLGRDLTSLFFFLLEFLSDRIFLSMHHFLKRDY